MDLETLEAFAWAAEDRASVVSTLPPGSAEQFSLLWRLDECARGNREAKEESELTPAQRSTLDAYVRDHRYDGDVTALQWRRKLANLAGGSAESKDDTATSEVLRALGHEIGASFSHSRPSDGIVTTAPSSIPSSLPPTDDLNDDARLVQAAVRDTHSEGVPPVRLTSPHAHAMAAHMCGVPGTPLTTSQARRCVAYLRALGRLPDVEDAVRVVLGPLSAHACSSDASRASGVTDSVFTSVVDALLPRMTLDEVHAVAEVYPSYLSRAQWVIAILQRMALAQEHAEDVRTPEAGVYLDSLATLCARLNGFGNMHSVVHAVAYHRLRRVLTLSEVEMLTPASRELFKSFISMPRSDGRYSCPASYHQDHSHVRMGDGREMTSHLSFPAPTLEQDEALIASCLQALLTADGASMAGGDTPTVLRPYVHALPVAPLKDILATCIITGGLATPDDVAAAHAWCRSRGVDTSSLSATSIVFKESNASRFLPGEEVQLAVVVRGCDRFTVRVFECATTHIYMETGAEIATDLNLDGLEPTHSWEVETGIPTGTSLAVSRSVILPVHGRGVYVCECVHARVCTRALVRVGCIRMVETLTCAGHELTLCDEDFVPLPPAAVTVHVSGDTYRCGDNGRVCVPFTASTHSAPLIMTYTPPESDDLSFSTLVPGWTHAHEWYTLNASVGLAREAVSADNYSASLCVRAQLRLHGSTFAPLRALSGVTLTLASRDSDGNASTQIVRGFKLSETAESSHSFAVPHAVTNLSVTLSGDVEILATGAKVTLTHVHAREYNRVCASDGIATAHLRADVDGYYSVFILGRNGEPFCDVSVDVIYSDHACVTSTFSRTLRTDAAGRVRVGRIQSFTNLRVSSAVLTTQALFDVPGSHACVYPSLIHTCEAAQDGVHARLPWPAAGAATTLTRADASLVRMDAHHCRLVVADAFAHLRVSDGSLRVTSLPAGVYTLTLRRSHSSSTTPTVITIHVAPSARARAVAGNVCINGHVWSTPSYTRLSHADGALSINTYMPLHILDARVEGDALVARIAVGSRTRVRLHTYSSVFSHSDAPAGPLMNCSEDALAHSFSSYPRVRLLAARTLGDEAVYVMKRTATRARIRGNLAPRPSLLLNPWSQRVVSTSTQQAGDGTSHARFMDSAAYGRSVGAGGASASSLGSSSALAYDAHTCLDFLSLDSTKEAHNLPVPPSADTSGLVTVSIPLADICSPCACMITLLAMDEFTAASLVMPVCPSGAPDAPIRVRDLSRASIRPDAHIIPVRTTSVLRTAGACVSISALGSYSRAEVYASFDRAFGLCVSMASQPSIAASFNWMCAWPMLSDVEKRAAYSTRACHEMHMWLFMHDPAFFDTVVRPFIACKRAMTLVDHWLLGHDLTAYTAPHVLASLNGFERALLCARVARDVARSIAARLRDEARTTPTPSATLDAIFAAALASNALSPSAAATAAVELEKQAGAEAARRMEQRRQREAAADRAPKLDEVIEAMSQEISLTMDTSDQSLKSAPGLGGRVQGMLASSSYGGGGARGGAMPSASFAAMPMSRSVASRAPMAMSGGLRAPGGPMPPAPEMKRKSRASTATKERAQRDETEEEAASSGIDDDEGGMGGEEDRGVGDAEWDRREAVRTSAKVQYRAQDVTEEFAEAHYHRIRVHERVDVPAFSELWADFAEWCVELNAALSRAGEQHACSAAHAHAVHIAAHPFISPHFALPAHAKRLNETLLSLAVCGLPFESAADAPRVTLVDSSGDDDSGEGMRITYTAGSTAALLFHRETAPVEPDTSTPILIAERYVDPRDASETSPSGVRTEKYMSPNAAGAIELVTGCVYSLYTHITNTSARTYSCEALVCIPAGALPVRKCKALTPASFTLSAYATHTVCVHFYMPVRAGATSYARAGTHVCSNARCIAFAPATRVAPVAVRTNVDTTSWNYISVTGNIEDVCRYLRSANLAVTDLSRILWRCARVGDWRTIVSTLEERMAFDARVWAYALTYGDVARTREYLTSPAIRSQVTNKLFASAAGPMHSLVTCTCTERDVSDTGRGSCACTTSNVAVAITHGTQAHWYEHLEYAPLINARAHVLGEKRRILNEAVLRQYTQLLQAMSVTPRSSISAPAWLALTYLLLLQDRCTEAVTIFARVVPPRDAVAQARTASRTPAGAPPAASSFTLQYDYMAAFLDMYACPEDDAYAFPIARAVVSAYAEYPVPHWASRFRELAAHLSAAGVLTASVETATEVGAVADKERAREAALSRGVDLEPFLDMRIERARVCIRARNLSHVSLRVYDMDIERLFSSAPFITAGVGDDPSASAALGAFAYVRPNASMMVNVLPASGSDAEQDEVAVPLPPTHVSRNCMIQAASRDGVHTRVGAHFATDMAVTVAEPLGRLKVTHAASGAPLAAVYVKVYMRPSVGAKARFFKDGYTDIRGAFDYTSLSTDDLTRAERLAILILSDTHGACVRVAKPPPNAGKQS